MRDMFDEFMEELRRRQAELEGKNPKAGADKDHDAGEAGESPADSPNGKPEEETVTSMGSNTDDEGSPSDADEGPEPPRIRFGGGRGSNSGGFGGGFDEFPEFHVSRGWLIVGGVIVAFFILSGLLSLGVGILTDAIWFNSVGFGGVFWTRLWSQVGSFAGSHSEAE